MIFSPIEFSASKSIIGMDLIIKHLIINELPIEKDVCKIIQSYFVLQNLNIKILIKLYQFSLLERSININFIDLEEFINNSREYNFINVLVHMKNSGNMVYIKDIMKNKFNNTLINRIMNITMSYNNYTCMNIMSFDIANKIL